MKATMNVLLPVTIRIHKYVYGEYAPLARWAWSAEVAGCVLKSRGYPFKSQATALRDAKREIRAHVRER